MLELDISFFKTAAIILFIWSASAMYWFFVNYGSNLDDSCLDDEVRQKRAKIIITISNIAVFALAVYIIIVEVVGFSVLG